MTLDSKFNLRSGIQRTLALLALLLAAAGFCVMLGSVAALQASCNNDLNLGTNNNLASATGGAGAGTGAGSLTSVLASRSTTDAFVLTPDVRCSQYYRYLWVTVSLEAFILFLCFIALVSNLLHVSRVALCCILAVVTVMVIECANTFFYAYRTFPGVTRTRSKAFFAGTIATIIGNFLLMMLLGTHNEVVGYNGFVETNTGLPTLRTYQVGGAHPGPGVVAQDATMKV